MVDYPEQPDGVDWPGARWPRGTLDDRSQRRLEAAVDDAFTSADLPGSLAEVIVHRGRVVLERYHGTTHLPGQQWGADPVAIDADTPLLSWSMAKSVTSDLIGLLVHDGVLRVDQPAGFEPWAHDERASITIAHLLGMVDGLAFEEDYVDAGVSDVMEMLFGSGKDDVAAYAMSRPLAHPPGTRWNYSSGATNLLAAVIARHVGAGATAAMAARRLFEPIGMTTASITMDAAGTFVGSSYVHACALDYARFGLLHLRGGHWDGVEVLPRAWVDYQRTPVDVVDDPDGYGYGAQFWLWPDAWGHPGTFSCQGYQGQRIVCVPTSDSVVVRLGRTPVEHAEALRAHLVAVLDCLAASSGVTDIG